MARQEQLAPPQRPPAAFARRTAFAGPAPAGPLFGRFILVSPITRQPPGKSSAGGNARRVLYPLPHFEPACSAPGAPPSAPPWFQNKQQFALQIRTQSQVNQSSFTIAKPHPTLLKDTPQESRLRTLNPVSFRGFVTSCAPLPGCRRPDRCPLPNRSESRFHKVNPVSPSPICCKSQPTICLPVRRQPPGGCSSGHLPQRPSAALKSRPPNRILPAL